MSDDMVNNPPHYNRKNIEAICAIEASMEPEEFCGYLKGNILKYLWRYNYKGTPLQDLEKSEYYLKLLIKKVKESVQPIESKSES
jgi:hypothetical protein|tara:strand:- start:46490 stop:46744 length:255 start_codon:yes stop_codon:yes gene_type:complete